MYAKVFEQIFDSSIANNYPLRHFFMDLLVLAESDGVVDMTQEAISSRTRIPLDVVCKMLTELEQPDARSRTRKQSGCRIVRLDRNRDWGWRIVNYLDYRDIRDEDERKDYMRDYMRNYRKQRKQSLTSVNSHKPMQKQKHTQKQKHLEANIPTLEEIKTEASLRGIPESVAVKFFDHYQGNQTWLNQHDRLIDWRHKLKTWSENERATPKHSSQTPDKYGRVDGLYPKGHPDEWKNAL